MQKPLDPSLALAVADVIREQLAFVRTEFAEERKVLEGTISELNARLSALPGALAQEIADLTHRLTTLESREPPKGLTLEDVAPLVTQAFEAYPKPKDGDPGKDADPLSIDDIQPVVDLAVKEAVAALPPPKDGTSVTLGDIWPHVSDHLDKAVASLPKPENGKDASIDDIRPIVALAVSEAVSALPPPKDGTSVAVEDVVGAVVPFIMDEVRDAVGRIPKPKDGDDAEPVDVERLTLDVLSRIPPPDLGPLTEKIAALETRPTTEQVVELVQAGLACSPFIAAIDKADLSIEALAANVDERFKSFVEPFNARIAAVETRTNVDHINLDNVHERVMALEAKPPPEKGKDADPVDLEALALDVLARIPVPKDGTSVTVDDIAVILMDEHEKWAKIFEAEALTAIEKMVDEIPRPKDGKSVTIEDVQHFLEASYAKWALEAERRVIDLAQRAIDRMPTPKDGTDGIGFDDLTISRDGRKIRHDYMRNGEVVKSFEFKTDELRYQDVYRAGESYDVGDVVSWGGSIWIAMADNSSKPGNGNPDWKLSVKEGRKGKSAYDSARDNGFIGTEQEWLKSLQGPKGDKGDKGKDLTQLGPDGRKW